MKIIKLLFAVVIISNSVKAQVDCLPSGHFAYLDINNVKARITSGSSLWQDLSTGSAAYEFPAGSGETVIYAGNFGIGGLDGSNNLHFSGATFENSTFFPGPIRIATATTEGISCAAFDRVWKINRWEVEEFVLKYQDPNYTIPEVILSWPAHGNTADGYAQNLAPFHDSNSDGIYNPYDGDYPEFDLDGTLACGDIIYGDQCIYWIINDVGNNQSSNALGIEVHMQAYAYLGGESINNTTFYRYKVINRSANNYTDTYFANWTDSDIGCSEDDYAGCDVQRGMGYQFNADSIDNDGCNGTQAIGVNPPAAGIDFVQGPLAVIGDNIDNNRDGNIDEVGERHALSTFMYFNRNLPANIYGDPGTDLDYYNYCKGIWKDGTPLTYGGDGHGGTVPTTFAFPDDSDLTNWYGTGGINAGGAWSEITEGITKFDRRMLNAVGPFNLNAGQTEVITFAVISAKDLTGDNLTSLEKLKLADDTIQSFSDGCYAQACTQLVETFMYSNNAATINFAYGMDADTYNWDFGDGNTATTRFPSNTYTQYGTYSVCLTASNSCSSITVCKDVNAYFSNSLAFDITRIEGMGNAGRELEITQNSIDSMFILGNNFITQPTYEAHKAPILIEAIDLDSIINGNYIVQFDGVDSSANWKMYREGAVDTVYSNLTIGSNNRQIIPQWGVAVIVHHYAYTIISTNVEKTESITSEIIATGGNQWLTGLSDKDTYSAENWIASGALSIYCDAATYPNSNDDPCSFGDYLGYDDYEEYEQIVNGTFAPFKLTRYGNHGPLSISASVGINASALSDIQSIDIVFTPDTSKWSRCPIFETHDNSSQTIGNAYKNQLRLSPSVDKNGASDGTGNGMGWFPGYAINIETGERLNIGFGEDSYHPAENGADMLFNPTSTVYDANGDTVFGGKHYIYVFRNRRLGFFVPSQILSTMPNYDEGNMIESLIGGGNAVNAGTMLKVWRACAWVGIPLLENGETLLSSDAKVRIRVKKPLEPYGYTIADTINNTLPMYSAYIDASISSLENQQPFDVKVFPNPTEENITFYLTNSAEVFNLEIFDITGKIYKSEILTESSITVNVSDLSKGIYLYYLYNKDGSRLSKGKFIKQ